MFQLYLLGFYYLKEAYFIYPDSGKIYFTEVWIRKLRQSYFACVSYIDKLIGDVLQGLKEAKLHKDTIVILLGDHGKCCNFKHTIMLCVLIG